MFNCLSCQQVQVHLHGGDAGERRWLQTGVWAMDGVGAWRAGLAFLHQFWASLQRSGQSPHHLWAIYPFVGAFLCSEDKFLGRLCYVSVVLLCNTLTPLHLSSFTPKWRTGSSTLVLKRSMVISLMAERCMRGRWSSLERNTWKKTCLWHLPSLRRHRKRFVMPMTKIIPVTNFFIA